MIKIDLGCGTRQKEGFEGVDIIAFPGVVHVVDLREKWPWRDESVSEARCYHFIEHLEAHERIHFANELHRVLTPGGICEVAVPHWASPRAYGDLTHRWPPVSEMWFFYLSRRWRAENAPHEIGYDCDFDLRFGYALNDQLQPMNDQQRTFALQWYKQAADDIVAWLTKR